MQVMSVIIMSDNVWSMDALSDMINNDHGHWPHAGRLSVNIYVREKIVYGINIRE